MKGIICSTAPPCGECNCIGWMEERSNFRCLFGFNILQVLFPLTRCLFDVFCKSLNFSVSSAKDYNVVAIAIAMAIVIALFGLAIVFFIVYKKKTRASTHLPQTLVSSS